MSNEKTGKELKREKKRLEQELADNKRKADAEENQKEAVEFNKDTFASAEDMLKQNGVVIQEQPSAELVTSATLMQLEADAVPVQLQPLGIKLLWNEVNPRSKKTDLIKEYQGVLEAFVDDNDESASYQYEEGSPTFFGQNWNAIPRYTADGIPIDLYHSQQSVINLCVDKHDHYSHIDALVLPVKGVANARILAAVSNAGHGESFAKEDALEACSRLFPYTEIKSGWSTHHDRTYMTLQQIGKAVGRKCAPKTVRKKYAEYARDRIYATDTNSFEWFLKVACDKHSPSWDVFKSVLPPLKTKLKDDDGNVLGEVPHTDNLENLTIVRDFLLSELREFDDGNHALSSLIGEKFGTQTLVIQKDWKSQCEDALEDILNLCESISDTDEDGFIKKPVKRSEKPDGEKKAPKKSKTPKKPEKKEVTEIEAEVARQGIAELEEAQASSNGNSNSEVSVKPSITVSPPSEDADDEEPETKEVTEDDSEAAVAIRDNVNSEIADWSPVHMLRVAGALKAAAQKLQTSIDMSETSMNSDSPTSLPRHSAMIVIDAERIQLNAVKIQHNLLVEAVKEYNNSKPDAEPTVEEWSASGYEGVTMAEHQEIVAKWHADRADSGEAEDDDAELPEEMKFSDDGDDATSDGTPAPKRTAGNLTDEDNSAFGGKGFSEEAIANALANVDARKTESMEI